MDEKTLDVLVNYTAGALKVCSAWTHSDILLALSTVVYGNGHQCQQVGILISNYESGITLDILNICIEGFLSFAASQRPTG